MWAKKLPTWVTIFCCLHDFGRVPYIVPLNDLGRLSLRVLTMKQKMDKITFTIQEKCKHTQERERERGRIFSIQLIVNGQYKVFADDWI